MKEFPVASMMIRVEAEIGDAEASGSEDEVRCTTTICFRRTEDRRCVMRSAALRADAPISIRQANFVERIDILGVEREQELQRPEQVGGIERRDVDARALPHLEHAEDLEAAHGLAHARPADLHRDGEVAFGRQHVCPA